MQFLQRFIIVDIKHAFQTLKDKKSYPQELKESGLKETIPWVSPENKPQR
jgi:hypothetical protein